jgi:hypothetical protein
VLFDVLVVRPLVMLCYNLLQLSGVHWRRLGIQSSYTKIIWYLTPEIIMAKLTNEQFINGIRAHALKDYEFGWDVLVEAWDDSEILDAIKGCRTVHGACVKIWREHIQPRNAYANDIRNS